MFRGWNVLDRIVLYCIAKRKSIRPRCACYLFICVIFLFSSFFFCLFETNHGAYKVRGNNNTENMILLDYMPSKFVVICFVRVLSVSFPLDSFIFVLCSHSHFAGLSISLFHGYVIILDLFWNGKTKLNLKKKRDANRRRRRRRRKKKRTQ